MENVIKTELDYMGVEIPVTIQKLGDNLQMLDPKIPLIWFMRNPVEKGSFKTLIDDCGCVILSDEFDAITIAVSNKFYDRPFYEGLRHKTNAEIKNHVKMVFDKRNEFDELIVVICGDESFILPIIDYVTDRYEDFEKISIYIDDSDTDAEYDVDEFMHVVRDYITNAWILKTKSELTHSYMQIYGNNKH